MSKRIDELLLKDIVESCDKIFKYTQNFSFEDFRDNSLVIDAVIRNFEIIGEASGQLSESFKNLHREIEWHRLSGMRNRIIHGYFGVDLEIVWSTIQNELCLTTSPPAPLLKERGGRMHNSNLLHFKVPLLKERDLG